MKRHVTYAMIGIALLVNGTALAQTPTPPLTDPSGDGIRAPAIEREATAIAASAAVPEPIAAGSAATPTVASAPPPRRDDSIASRPAYRPAPIGNATRNLLRQQVAGSQAGHALPVLGASATLSHQRYLDSFKHPIPERFESRVSGKSSGTN